MQTLMSILQATIYAISSMLFLPVMIGLVTLPLWCVVYGGYIVAEWFWRMKWRQNVLTNTSITSISNILIQKGLIFFITSPDFSTAVRQFCRNLREAADEHFSSIEQHADFILQNMMHNLTRNVDRLKIVVRLGPALGLMGTLIPMSTGLQALSQGDLTQVSSSLVVAFTTTVVGLAVGIVAQIFAVAKSRWANEDIQCMELIAEAFVEHITNKKTSRIVPEPVSIVSN